MKANMSTPPSIQRPSARTDHRADPEKRFATWISSDPVRDFHSVRQVWVSKFATQGTIFRINGEPRDDGWFTPEGETQALRIGRDCFLSRDEAALDADSRRRHKVTSLKNTLERIEKLIASD
ncbi:hypothetical protein [Nguyenibacter sp. L1]|uniref:hypothetical protein n=1 Tax=Nguyenibacter sp. L1 TaxID=3049350 RepID=UPI002B46763C|nr:hypothetical protein [Nguyenibacter sp. L1]WRH89099.1 hypothetical protein QN315_05595 [Nguyenibacter sp. L1]